MHVNYVQAVGAACKLHTNCTCTPEQLHVGRYGRSSGGGEVEPWDEYGIAKFFLSGDFFKGFHSQKELLAHVAWFETVLEADHRPGGILVKGPKLRNCDHHVPLNDLPDVACTINPKRKQRCFPANKDVFFMRFDKD